MSAPIPPQSPASAAGASPTPALPGDDGAGGTTALLTPEQRAVVEIVLSDPLIMQAISEALTGGQVPGSPVVDATNAPSASPGQVNPAAPQSLEQRILGA